MNKPRSQATIFREELRQMSTNALEKMLREAEICITRGMAISRTGVNQVLKVISGIEKELQRREA